LWNALGNTLARQWPEGAAEALSAHEKALAADPENPAYWYDLGLCHKYAGRFAEGVKATQRSLDITPGDESALWNVGICATGARHHQAAMEAWTKLHIDVELVDGEVRYTGRGIVQVRITERGPIVAPGDGDPGACEYLWIARMGPAHGRILSPTEGNFFADVGDVVLHDGAPVGYRDDGQSRVPRFPLMALLRRGTQRSFRFAAVQPGRGEIAGLAKSLGEESIYVHTEQVSSFCRECARSGRVPHQHERLKPDERIVYGKLVVQEGQLASFRAALDAVLRTRDDLALYCPDLHRELGDEVRAAAEEKAWTALAYS
jgi:tetratricopeptide (TPR) repeat protein